MTRYWKAYLWSAAVILLLNLIGYIIPWGADNIPIQSLGFPRAFWRQFGQSTTFRPGRLVADILFALIICHKIARWFQTREDW